MEKQKDRFFKKFVQETLKSSTEIWVDRETGVNYLYHQNGNSGGLTPLLDSEGKIFITYFEK